MICNQHVCAKGHVKWINSQKIARVLRENKSEMNANWNAQKESRCTWSRFCKKIIEWKHQNPLGFNQIYIKLYILIKQPNNYVRAKNVHNYCDICEQRKLILEFPDNLSHCQNYRWCQCRMWKLFLLQCSKTDCPRKKCVRLSNMNLFQKISFQSLFPLLFSFLNYRSRPIFFSLSLARWPFRIFQFWVDKDGNNIYRKKQMHSKEKKYRNVAHLAAFVERLPDEMCTNCTWCAVMYK